jgi:4-amino-4-deoxy-L-arabinose transferase-like glycosyltransferase
MRLRRFASAQSRPLVLLLLVSAILGAAWALLLPAWQAPDEHSHFGYAQTLAERGELPASEGERRYSTEQDEASKAVGADQLAGNPYARAQWSSAVYERWRRLQAAQGPSARSDGEGADAAGNANTARTNPPLYYAFEALPYYAASGTDLFGRLYLMRLWSALLLLVAAAASWALIGELLGPRRGLQLAGSALVALQPMAIFVSASINPDAMLIPAFALALWLGVRVIRRGLTLGSGAALCAAAAVAILAKGTGYALLPGVALALGIGAWRAGVGLRLGSLTRSALPLLALALPVGAWLVYARLSDRPAINQVGGGGGAEFEHAGLFSYLWQFYLPHVPGQMPLPPGYTPLPVVDVWLEGFWGKFGWLEIALPSPLYLAAGLVTAALIVGGGAALVRSGLRRHAATVAFLALVTVSLLGGLHLTEYRILADQGSVFNQGRYLLPLLPLLGLAAAAALSLARGRMQQLLAGGLIGFLFVLQVVSLAIVGARFYA